MDLEAYERLHRARLRPNESFSKVIKRAHWTAPPSTGASLLKSLETAPMLDESVLDRLDDAQRMDVEPDDSWNDLR